jgi:hypothetical protein
VASVKKLRYEWLNDDPAYCEVERSVIDVLRRQFDKVLEITP